MSGRGQHKKAQLGDGWMQRACQRHSCIAEYRCLAAATTDTNTTGIASSRSATFAKRLLTSITIFDY
ncbi:hypothetical protein J6590_025064 [Homalodisca vitripennis]|nr:hypothetical protein J6590_025064 [Homalodisca vitripennis]